VPSSDVIVLLAIVLATTGWVVRLWRGGVRGRRFAISGWLGFLGILIVVALAAHCIDILSRLYAGTGQDGAAFAYNFRVYSLLLLGVLLIGAGINLLRAALGLSRGMPSARQAFFAVPLGVLSAVTLPLVAWFRDASPSPANDRFLTVAIEEARAGLAEGGIPIGSVLVVDDKIVGRGHNRRVQKGSATLHAEMDCLENAGRLRAADYRRATLYSTLSPCDMCSGASLLYGIPRIVIGENRTFQGPEDHLRSRGVVLEIVDDAECVRMMREFIAARPELWNEDVGR
jgi:cytosine/creatinine deaminase